MDVVTISSKYRVVIPLSVRRSLGLKLGQKVQVILYENRIELIPVMPPLSVKQIAYECCGSEKLVRQLHL